MKNNDINIDASKWEAFAISDKSGVESVKETYNRYLNNLWKKDILVWIDEIEPIFKLRAEKWKGVNDELHECYLSLLKGKDKDLKEIAAREDDLPF